MEVHETRFTAPSTRRPGFMAALVVVTVCGLVAGGMVASSAAWAQHEASDSAMAPSDQAPPGAHAGHGAKAARPVTAIVALAIGLVCAVLWVVAVASKRSHTARQILVGVALLGIAYGVTSYVVWKYKKPGQMSVMEAQAMDMSAMKPPLGGVPVSTEVVERALFRSTVTYTGTVVAYNDEDVYPRVIGTIVEMPVYPGDMVQRGQVIARLDSVELSARAREAAMAREGAAAEQRVALARVSASESSLAQAEADLRRSRSALAAAESRSRGAAAAVKEAQQEREQAVHDLAAAEAELKASRSAKRAADSKLESARSSVSTAQAEVASAEADATYWRSEIKRAKVLVDEDAISRDEYEREEAKLKTAEAKVDRAEARVKQCRADVATAEAEVGRAEAVVGTAEARVRAMKAAVERAAAGVERAQAGQTTADAEAQQAREQVAGGEATVAQKTADVKASQAGEEVAVARSSQRAAGSAAASTVRDYTEIRSTVSGRVIQRLVSPGVLVSPGMPLLRIAQIDKVRLQAYVSETDLPHINAGAAVHVGLASDPERGIETEVTSVFPQVDAKARTAIVEAIAPNADDTFVPGQSVTMEIETGAAADAITVPSRAVVERIAQTEGPHSENRPAVWVVRSEAAGAGNTAHLVFVETGRKSDERTEVLSGLNEGDEVVVRGYDYLREGQTVIQTQWSETGPIELTEPQMPARMEHSDQARSGHAH